MITRKRWTTQEINNKLGLQNLAKHSNGLNNQKNCAILVFAESSKPNAGSGI